MAEMVVGAPVSHLVSGRLLTWLQLVLATPVVLWGGWPFFERGWASIVNRSFNMFTLIAIGTGTAYGYSIVATVFPDLLPEAFRGTTASPWSTSRRQPSSRRPPRPGAEPARSQTSSAIQALLGLAPKTARRLRDDGTKKISHSHTSTRGTACASVPERRSLLTGWCLRARVPWMSRCSPGSRCRWKRPLAVG